jgi:hypothetical protein
MLDVLVVASAPEAVARTTASPKATLANIVFLSWLASGLLTERFSQYDLRRQKSMTERFGHRDVIALSGDLGDGHPRTQARMVSRVGKNHRAVLEVLCRAVTITITRFEAEPDPLRPS